MVMDVGKQIVLLKHMSARELQAKYREVFGEPTAACNKDFLFKRIVWRMQALAEGDLSERARRRAAELARDADLRTTIPRPPPVSAGAEHRTVTSRVPYPCDGRLPPPGTVLSRTYRGRAHLVTVLPDGFEYEGRAFHSLSAIAKIITGSHWNGYLFFKLPKPQEQSEETDA
jgi:hypothetical protein